MDQTTKGNADPSKHQDEYYLVDEIWSRQHMMPVSSP